MSEDDLDFMTQEEIDEILSIENDLGIDISLDEIMEELAETEDEDSDWAE